MHSALCFQHTRSALSHAHMRASCTHVAAGVLFCVSKSLYAFFCCSILTLSFSNMFIYGVAVMVVVVVAVTVTVTVMLLVILYRGTKTAVFKLETEFESVRCSEKKGGLRSWTEL